MCGKDSAVDPSAGIGDISDKDHICNRSKTDQACIGQENDDKRIRLIRSWAVPNVSPTWEITPCVNAEHGSVPKWISISQESPNPWMRTPSMTMISLFLNFSGLANQFNFS